MPPLLALTLPATGCGSLLSARSPSFFRPSRLATSRVDGRPLPRSHRHFTKRQPLRSASSPCRAGVFPSVDQIFLSSPGEAALPLCMSKAEGVGDVSHKRPDTGEELVPRAVDMRCGLLRAAINTPAIPPGAARGEGVGNAGLPAGHVPLCPARRERRSCGQLHQLAQVLGGGGEQELL